MRTGLLLLLALPALCAWAQQLPPGDKARHSAKPATAKSPLDNRLTTKAVEGEKKRAETLTKASRKRHDKAQNSIENKR